VCGSTRTRGYTRTRPVPAGMGRVRVDVLRVGSGTGIPVFTSKERHLSRCSSYIECFFSSFLANVVVRPSVCRLSVCLSVVCNVRAPYSGD